MRLLTLRQIFASWALAMRRLGHGKLFVACITLGALPILVVFLIVIPGHQTKLFDDMAKTNDMFEVWVRTFYLNFIVFFLANILGFGVVRQERDDRTLHYLFLQPAARWVLVLGKLAAYLVLSGGLCLASLWIAYLFMSVVLFGAGPTMGELFMHGRLVILLKDSLVMILGLLAYGSIAMLVGSYFKSGLYAVLLLGWETGLPYLPTGIKLWTVMHYLQSLLPVRPTETVHVFELLGEPAPVWLCLVVLVALPLICMACCALVFHWRECLYSEA